MFRAAKCRTKGFKKMHQLWRQRACFRQMKLRHFDQQFELKYVLYSIILHLFGCFVFDGTVGQRFYQLETCLPSTLYDDNA